MKRTILLLTILFLIASLNILPVQGQQGEITIKSKTVQSQFPDGVVFEVAAETRAPDRIREIRLEMGIKGSNRTSYAYLDFASDTSVQGKYLLRASGAQHKPVGILIEYRFIITDSAGRNLETPKEEFLYMDNRFQWEKLSDGLIEVHYYGPIKSRAELILKAGVDTVKKMGALLGITPKQPIRVIVYNNLQHMAPALPFESRTTEAQLVREGLAFNEYGVLLMLASVPQSDGVASHEVTHMLVAEAIEGAAITMPTWLNEGLAEYGNVNPGTEYDAYLSQGIAQNRLFPLRQLQNPPGVASDTLLMYGQARSAVRFMVDTYGANKVAELFAAFKQGLEIDPALKQVYGFDQDGLDNAWRKSLGLPPLEQSPVVTPAPAPVPTPVPPSGQPEQPKPPTTPRRWGFGCAAPVAP